ncbi:MAG TPA: hypothetical protein VK427_03270 [Kofleriaceae bacterium]|nr:hypothetical protein [Kofleriaceae bacterium]
MKELGLLEKVKLQTVECKTLSCTTVLEVDPKEIVSVYDSINGIMVGDVHSPGYDQSTGQITLVNLFRGDARSDAYDAQFFAEAFAPALEAAKQQQQQRQQVRDE